MEEHKVDKEKTSKEKSQGSRKLFRSRSLRSVGNFMQRILRTLSSLSHLGDGDRCTLDLEDDEGGFKPKLHHGEKKGSSQEDLRLIHGGDSNNNLGKTPVPARCQDRLSWSSDDKVPGVQGMKNHGNTCFMNAVVQCLSNTDLLAEFLGMGQYRAELEKIKTNGEATRRSADEPPSAARGEVTETLAVLVRGLWTLEYTPHLSVEFKNVVSKHGSQFRGNSQQDALEFLLWLLDRVHEDLNSPSGHKAKPAAKPPPGAEHTLMIPSASSPADGGRSFVQEHFQAQYRSSLTCPHCHKQSDTFDPFLCVSLPIPLRQTRALNVILVFQTKQQRFLRIGLAVPLLGTVASLRQMVADEGSIPPDQVILAELYASGFQRSFYDDEDLNVIAEGDPVYAFQVPLPLPKTGGSSRPAGYPQNLPPSPRRLDPEARRLTGGGSTSSEFLAHGSKILLLLCNVESASHQTERFGPPLLMREDRTISWDQLQQSIMRKIHYLMKTDSQPPNGSALFRLRVAGDPTNGSYLSPKDMRPLQLPAVDRALQLNGAGGPPHVKLVIEWDPRTKERLFGSIQEEVVQDAESVRAQQLEHQQQSCTLDECFQLYTKEEQLAPDDAWRCPHCKVLQQGTVKLSLWTLPDILIIHLKRFRQVGGRRNKLSTLVRFPLTGMDMGPHVVKRGQGQKGTLGPWSSRKPSLSQLGVLYDLYAVCNHHGSLQGGHYTAYCRNSLDTRWYSYDDSNVEQLQEDEVCTRGAYILFYQKRNTIPAWSASSSVRGSTSSSMSDHWVLRLNGSKRESLVSRATNCIALPQIPDSPVFVDKEAHPEKGAPGSKPFARGVKGRSASMKVSSATKLKLSISKAMPLRWSFGSKDKAKRETGELVEYLESGRRPKYTNESIVPRMANTSKGDKGAGGPQTKPSHSKVQGASASVNSVGSHPGPLTSSSKVDNIRGRQKEKVNQQVNVLSTMHPARKDGSVQSKTRDKKSTGDLPSGANLSTADNVQHNKPPSGKREENNQKSVPKDVDNTRAKTSGSEGQQEGKSMKSQSSFVKKDSRKLNGPENPQISELPSGLSRTSLPKRIQDDGRTNGILSHHHKEDHVTGKSKTDIRRAQSSSNVQSKADWTLKRSISLYKNGTVSSQSSRQGAPEKVSSSPVQRMTYQTSSLGRKKTVPESSF
ncbi:ubiquitin carboxyl-terminal hydrolase 43 isoform X2 [Spea bombifrons]|uniref:ubiquitin carboxyl-terminal hydrolase 43 isoform X2 n=1 Tax=Spea bombifrons TaxID=233779 RepID=UPI00234A8507|nr:ubiquitin carboxyl-terminal hydrolase 43 isoform X2 [Spea bombifrons]